MEVPRIAAGKEPLPPPSEYKDFINPCLHRSTASFFAWRDEGYWFCDKTDHLALWDDLPDHVIFRRPPLFGKTLWMRILSAYYDIAVGSRTRAYYFGNLKIGRTPPKKTYLIMNIDLAHVDRTFWGQPDVRRAVFDALDAFIRKYKGLVKFEYNANKDPDPDPITAFHVVVRDVLKAGHEVSRFEIHIPEV